MSDRSLIKWCDATWNPISGCTPVSAGCANCYAAKMAKRFPHLHGTFDATMPGQLIPQRGRFLFSEIQFHPSRLDQPLRWKKPRRVFVGSMTDIFHEDVCEEWIDKVMDVICQCSQHTFMILTKRPKRMKDFVEGYADESFPNVYFGVTVENQEMADQRIPILLQTPVAKRFVSVEPMLGPVDLTRIPWANDPIVPGSPWTCLHEIGVAAFVPELRRAKLDWVICGGESGSGARFMHPHWVENLRDQCTEAGVPFFFKGWGTKMMKKSDPGYMMLDGCEWKEFPA